MAQRYEFYVRVAETISHSFDALTREISLLPQEHKIHIHFQYPGIAASDFPKARGVTLCHTQGTENGVCNHLAQEKINFMLILRICAFSPPELLSFYVDHLKYYLTKGGGGGGAARPGVTGTPGSPLWLRP